MPRPEERDAEEATAVLKWPPPGLSRMQGDLWTVVKQAGTGGALLVFPLLWSLASEQELWSLGPLGGSWWVVLLTSFAGLALLVNAFVGLFRLCRRAASATDRGYGWITLALVASDARRDAGFLLQGARAYSVLDPEERRRLIVQRLVAVAAYLGAVLWLPAGFAAGLLFAGRGILSPSSFALFTLAPAALLATVALLVRIVESRTVRRAKRAWFDQPWSRDLAQGEVASWNLAYAERREAPLPGPGAIGEGRRFRIGAALVLGLAVLVFLPALTLLFATAMGPVVGGVSAPEYSGTQRKAASVEAFRPYVLAADSAITPIEAGEILHSLSFVGTTEERDSLIRPTSTSWEGRWIPDLRGGPTQVFPNRWSVQLMPRAARGQLTAEEEAFLEGVAAHPAHRALARLARAPAIDVAGARWRTPLPSGTSLSHIPVPNLSALREAGWATVGTAALHASRGRNDAARATLRRLLTVGFLLQDHGPTLLDNLIGSVLAITAGDALLALLEGTGNADEAASLRRAREASERSMDRMEITSEDGELGAALQEMAAAVENPDALRGLRWEYFITVNTVAPCISPHKVLFGPGDSYERWVESAREGLVRHPSEEELFELARWGWGSPAAAPEAHGLTTLLGLTLGGRGQAGSCASLLGRAGTPGPG